MIFPVREILDKIANTIDTAHRRVLYYIVMIHFQNLANHQILMMLLFENTLFPIFLFLLNKLGIRQTTLKTYHYDF